MSAKWLFLIPFAAYVFPGVFLANRVEPFVMGMPFFYFWSCLWILLTSVTIWLVYRLEQR